VILVSLVDEAGAHRHVGLAGRHSLVQDYSLLLECLNKVRISVLETRDCDTGNIEMNCCVAAEIKYDLNTNLFMLSALM